MAAANFQVRFARHDGTVKIEDARTLAETNDIMVENLDGNWTYAVIYERIQGEYHALYNCTFAYVRRLARNPRYR